MITGGKRCRLKDIGVRLAVMMYIRYPLSLRQVEDLLFERNIDICHETVRFWWNRFGPMFAAEIRKAAHSSSVVFAMALASGRGVRADQRRDALPVARRGSRRRGARGFRHETPGSQGCAEVSEANDETLRPTAVDRDGPTSVLRCGDEGDWKFGAIRNAVVGSTIEPKTHTSRFDDERARWRNSGTSRPCRSSLPLTPRSTIISTTTVTSIA